MNGESANQGCSTSAKAPQRGAFEKRLFRFVVIGFVIVFATAFIPVFGLVVFIPVFIIGLLWFYAGVLEFCVVFPTRFFFAMRRGTALVPAITSAARWVVIAFAATGLMLFPAFLIVPGYKTFTLGNWIHAKIWLSVPDVRRWATEQDPSASPRHSVPYRQWPTSLKVANLGSGELRVTPTTKTVTVIDGGGFGHWGIQVAPAGTTAPQIYGYVIPLEDGAWVWHEIQ